MKILKNGIYVFFGNSAVALSGLIISAVLTSNQGLAFYGEYVLYLSVFMVWGAITKPNTWQAIVKFSATCDLNILTRESIFLEVLIFIISSVILFLLVLVVQNLGFFEGSSFWIVILALVVGGPLVNNGTLLGRARSRGDYFSISIVQLLSSITKVLICFLVDGDAKELFFTVVLFESFLWGLALTRELLIKNTGSRVDGNVSKSAFIRFSIWGSVHTILDLPVTHLDKLLVGALLGKEASGILDIIKKIAQCLGQIANPIYMIVFPEFSRWIANGWKDKVISACKKTTFALLAFGAFFVLCLYVFFNTLDIVLFSSNLSDKRYLVVFYAVIQSLALSFIWVHPLSVVCIKMAVISAIVAIANILYLTTILFLSPVIGLYAIVYSFALQASILIGFKLFYISRSMNEKNIN